MMKKLTRHGNSLAVVIDKPILNLLKIDASTPLEIRTDGQSLIITPKRVTLSREKLEQALAGPGRRGKSGK